MPVILKNTKRQAFYGTYYVQITGRRTSARLYTVQRVRSQNGKIVGERQPHSFMVPALGSTEVHDVALHLPQVKAALKSGWLKKQEAAPVVSEPASTVATTMYSGASNSAVDDTSTAPASGGASRRRRR